VRDVPPSYTVPEAARHLRVGETKVRHWIASGELTAINTASALCRRPRYVVTAEAMAAFERRRSGAAPPKPKRQKRTVAVDYYPD
jgi:excisionase family DNA binding protein